MKTFPPVNSLLLHNIYEHELFQNIVNNTVILTLNVDNFSIYANISLVDFLQEKLKNNLIVKKKVTLQPIGK